ncbi:MAG: hypothetical protein KKH98_09160 [Spirochaetes bacterium]|nr:hypothetical protein [Spirochaetota bacterium]
MKKQNRILSNVKIGWIIPEKASYRKAMASTRIRVYDIIKGLKKYHIWSGLYKSYLSYNIVIFQKAFSSKYLQIALELKEKNTKIIFDINVNYIDFDKTFVTGKQKKDIKEMLKISDFVITPTKYLADVYRKFHHQVYVIEEMIDDRFFSVKKKHKNNKSVNLLYCGYAIKAQDLNLIKDVLKKIYSQYKTGLILICDKDPCLDIIPYTFVKYNINKLHKLFLLGDIKISPRDLTRKYNLGHAFTKIGYPMAVGLPVVASPVFSYKESPAILCNTIKEWKNSLEQLILNERIRNDLAYKGINYVRNNYTERVITRKYIQLFKKVLDK